MQLAPKIGASACVSGKKGVGRMNTIIYLIGLIVVVLIILALLGVL